MRARPPSPGVRAVFGWSAVAMALLLIETPVGVAWAEEPAEFEMEEVSAFGKPGGDGWLPAGVGRVQGQMAGCSTTPNPTVKAYPELQSDTPYYGSIVFDRDPLAPDSGVTFHFVIDESGQPAALLGSSRPSTYAPRGPAVQENVVTYDRLYFDANGDLDLTNDPVLKPIPPPLGSEVLYPSNQKVVFDYLSIPLDRGPDLGRGPVRILPRFFIYESDETSSAQVDFVAATVREGRIQIGSREYVARMSQEHMVGGRFDTPYVSVSLTLVEGPRLDAAGFLRKERILRSLRSINGKYYALSTTPAGDKLFVTPYEGDLGVFEISLSGRNIAGFSFSAELQSDQMQLPIDGRSFGLLGEARAPLRFEIPVGDYYPGYSTILFGGLSVMLSNNYHADGVPLRDFNVRPPVFGIKITKDKPFVLDFSTDPEVLFAQPARDSSFAPGEEVEVKAVLIDPEQDIMICCLYGMNEVASTYLSPDGASQSSLQPVLLDPDVIITDASGKEVGGGKLPFGSDGTCGYSWRVPEDIESGTYTITVKYDTRELYGKVEGSRDFVVKAN